MIKEIVGENEFNKNVIEASKNKPILVDFGASFCSPCKMMSTVLDELALDYNGKTDIVKVNTEDNENMPIAIKYSVMSIPNIKVFKEGSVILSLVGYMPKEMLKERLAHILD